MSRWWKVWFLLPFSLFTFNWASRARKTKTKKPAWGMYVSDGKDWRNIKESIFAPVDEYMREKLDTHLKKNGYINVKGLEFSPCNFEAQLVMADGKYCMRHSVDKFHDGLATCPPGTYGGVIIRTPMLEVFKYVGFQDIKSMTKQVYVPLRKKITACAGDKMSVEFGLNEDGGMYMGEMVLKWDVVQ